MKWSEYFIRIADLVSKKSKDPSTKVGAVIVGPDHEIRSTGYNDLPRKVNDTLPERRERPLKYSVTEHAERNAIFNAARAGISTRGCTMYLNFEPRPCVDCSRAVIQAGIVQIVGANREFSGKGKHWNESLDIGTQMLKEAGVVMRTIEHITDKELQ